MVNPELFLGQETGNTMRLSKDWFVSDFKNPKMSFDYDLNFLFHATLKSLINQVKKFNDSGAISTPLQKIALWCVVCS